MEDHLQCKEIETRKIEWDLRRRIYYHEHFHDDMVIEKEWIVQKVIRNSGWGLESKWIESPNARGASTFDPILKAPSDIEKLHFPKIIYDKEATEHEVEKMQEMFGDILDIKLKGVTQISYHLMNQYTSWRGLRQMMTDMFLQPKMLCDVVEFLVEGHHNVLKQYTDLNLLSLNNNGTYHSSGGNGYTNELPKPGFNPDRVRPCDMWASAEAQEMAQVGPKQHKKFTLEYEKELLKPFGLNGYGCCEDLTHKLDEVLEIPHLRRISISPFSDVEICAKKLQGNYIFSWKPHPTYLIGQFDEKEIRKYIRNTLVLASKYNCILEMILKDTHTCENHPERFDRWSKIASEEVNRINKR
jgi:hypothetical protein